VVIYRVFIIIFAMDSTVCIIQGVCNNTFCVYYWWDYTVCFHMTHFYKVLFQVFTLLEFLDDSPVKVVTVRNCYIH
jgi:hypothetical protein